MFECNRFVYAERGRTNVPSISSLWMMTSSSTSLGMQPSERMAIPNSCFEMKPFPSRSNTLNASRISVWKQEGTFYVKRTQEGGLRQKNILVHNFTVSNSRLVQLNMLNLGKCVHNVYKLITNAADGLLTGFHLIKKSAGLPLFCSLFDSELILKCH